MIKTEIKLSKSNINVMKKYFKCFGEMESFTFLINNKYYSTRFELVNNQLFMFNNEVKKYDLDKEIKLFINDDSDEILFNLLKRVVSFHAITNLNCSNKLKKFLIKKNISIENNRICLFDFNYFMNLDDNSSDIFIEAVDLFDIKFENYALTNLQLMTFNKFNLNYLKNKQEQQERLKELNKKLFNNENLETKVKKKI